MQSFDCLVIVYSDPAVFALQVGQLDVVVRCRLIYFHDFHRFVEKGGKDELGFLFNVRQRIFFGSSVGNFHTAVAVGVKYIFN